MSNTPENQKNPLKEYFESLSEGWPRLRLRDELIAGCGVNIVTVYRWFSGKVTPDKLKREKIAEIIGIPVEQLFPDVYQQQESSNPQHVR